LLDPQIIAGGDDVIEYTENALMSVEITNNLGFDMTNTTMSIAINDNYFVLNDSTESIGTIQNGGSVNLIDAFDFDVLATVPNSYSFVIQSTLICDDTTIYTNFNFAAYSPLFEYADIFVLDSNNYVLDPGETMDIQIDEKNIGGSSSQMLSCLLTTGNEYVTINTDSLFFDAFEKGVVEPCIYNISISDDAPKGTFIDFVINFSEANGFNANDTLKIIIGYSYDSFETPEPYFLPWGNSGNKKWEKDSLYSYHGDYSIISGGGKNNQESVLVLDIKAEEDALISFYRKILNNYSTDDYYAYFIDGIEKEKLSNSIDWSQYSNKFLEGYHRLEWKMVYTNNHMHNSCWLDSVTLTNMGIVYHKLLVNKEELNFVLPPDTTISDTLIITHQAEFGSADYNIKNSYLYTNALARNISGSELYCNNNFYNPENNFIWEFVLTNNSPDNEWLKEVNLDLPNSIWVDSATNFVGGSEEMEFISGIGNGTLVHWYGENDNGYGVIQAKETAKAYIYGHADNEFREDFISPAEVIGENYGSPPHSLDFNLDFYYYYDWLNTSISKSTLNPGESDTLIISVNTNNMAQGDYKSLLVIEDNFNNELVIPVNLFVDFTLQTPSVRNNNSSFIVAPNPFKEEISLYGDFKSNTVFSMEIYNAQARKVYSQQFNGNINNQISLRPILPQGVYFLVVSYENSKDVIKIVKF